MPKIENDVLSVLSTVDLRENNLYITEQLERKLYQQVNEVLERIGGKWDKKAKAHVFKTNPMVKLEEIINTGMIDPKIKTGYFPTPERVVRQMIELLELKTGDIILEPSAGQGDIVKFLPKENLYLGEILPENIQILKERGFGDMIVCKDFLADKFHNINKIIMNPPFEKQQDIDHVKHALDCLKPGGILVSVMSAGVLFRNDKKTRQFRDDILNYAEVIPLSEGSFKESGTMVNAIIVKIKKE